MSKIELGKEQIKVMRVLWEKKRATAQEIADILGIEEPTKLVCVQMLLRRLVQKKIVAYDVDDRTYIYYPLVKQEHVTRYAFQSFVDHIFAGSTDDMVSYILKNEPLSENIMNEIRNLLEKEKNNEG